MKAWMLAVILAVVAIAPAICLVYYVVKSVPNDPTIASVQFEPQKVQKVLEVGVVFEVRACKVLDGFRYEMYLDNGKWIEVHLAVAAKDEANSFVVEWLNKTTAPPPSITLLRRVGNYWIVDFHLTVDGKRVNMVDLLRIKGLLL